MKICNKCREEKELEEFYKRKTNKDGYFCICKQCILERAKEHYKGNAKHKKEHMKEYYDKNKEHITECRKEYYDKNKEHIKEYLKEYYDKNKEHIKELAKEYYKNNKECVSKRHKEYSKEYSKTAQGKDAYRKRSHKRRATELQASRIIPDGAIEKLMTRKRCFYCNKSLKGNGHLEHMFPLSKGGLHCIDNLVMACPTCNLTKGCIDPYKWLIENKESIYSYDKVIRKLDKAHKALSLLI